MGLRLLAVWFVVALAVSFGPSRLSNAQDGDFFKPVIEVAPTKTPVGGQHVYSFSKLDPEFTALCVSLEQEGRRARLVTIAEAALERDKNSITLRAFWKMVIGACGRLGPKPTPTPRPDKSATRLAKGTTSNELKEPEEASAGSRTDSESSADSPQGSELATPTPSVGKSGTGERYPSVVMLDQVSRLSSVLYEQDSGEGPTAQMLRYFAKTVREDRNLPPIEREYYDIFFTYLLAAWEGRVDSTKLPTPTPSAVLREIFDFD